MRILERWLRDYISFSIPPQELADKLTMLGLEFESVERLDTRYAGFVVGKVLSADRHPNADRLSVCRVNVGKEELQIVCGAPNVAAGQTVPVGLIGATVPTNTHDPSGAPFVLKQVKIRGVESFGMICSEVELDLGKDGSGIMVLDDDLKPGTSVAAALGLDDVAYDIEITPNRPDWLSHLGMAREVAILTGKPPKLPAVRLKEGKEPIGKHLSVKVLDRKNCTRFAARMVRGVKIGPSPRWLQNCLRNAGLRPINNVVDITNFVMYECGHPMHAFDYALLQGKQIVVRGAAAGSSFTTLDGKSHTLPEGAVMVCDAAREVSIAGVMGGENSEIRPETVDVVLEAACWNPSSIRRTAKLLGISTDASHRFERGADPNLVGYALERAASLVARLAGGTILKGVIDVYPKKVAPKIITLRTSRVNTILGTNLSRNDVARSIAKLGMKAALSGKDAVRVTVPTYRVDCEREIDLVEEVARVYGYNNIEATESARVTFTHDYPRWHVRDSVREYLVGRGFREAITNSMQRAEIGTLGGVTPVSILNPQNQEMTVLRSSLVPGILESIARNRNFGNSDLRLFEIGHVFRMDASGKPHLVENFAETERICLAVTGKAASEFWSGESRLTDFFDAKGEAAGLLEKFALDKSRFIPYSNHNGLTENTLSIEIQGVYAGYLGQVEKAVLKKFDVDQDVFIVDLDLGCLQAGEKVPYVQLPKFPKVRRDVAFLVDAGVAAEEIVGTIRNAGTGLLQRVAVFDVYQGEPLAAGKKSVAFSLELLSREHTLTETEIEQEVAQVVGAVERSHGAALRTIG
jgi:phenylalanyl-tRNA synthetase beta chain